jgi:hypothetical protein
MIYLRHTNKNVNHGVLPATKIICAFLISTWTLMSRLLKQHNLRSILVPAITNRFYNEVYRAHSGAGKDKDLGRDAALLGDWIPSFRRKVLSSYSKATRSKKKFFFDYRTKDNVTCQKTRIIKLQNNRTSRFCATFNLKHSARTLFFHQIQLLKYNRENIIIGFAMCKNWPQRRRSYVTESFCLQDCRMQEICVTSLKCSEYRVTKDVQ